MKPVPAGAQRDGIADAGHRASWILWVDGGGGALVGTLLIGFHGLVACWYGLPERAVLALGAANLTYGAYGLLLARARRRSRGRLHGLILANALWPAVCAAMLVRHGSDATLLGQLHLGLEGLYVGALAAVEWCTRERLLSD